MKVYRPIILNQVDTFRLWVAFANVSVKRMQCDDCAAFHLLVNDIPRVGIQGTDPITRFLGVIALNVRSSSSLLRLRLEIEAKLILINNHASFYGLLLRLDTRKFSA